MAHMDRNYRTRANARRFVASGSILRVMTATAAVALAMAGSMAAAQPSAADTVHNVAVSARSSSHDCGPRQLHISVPDSIRGDPAEGMGSRSWNILLRNVSASVCAIRGWPRIVVLEASGREVATSVSDVKFSNLGPVPDSRITIRPGRGAVVTVTGAAAATGCVSRWTLRLTLPGASRPVTVAGPAGANPPCAGGHLQLSPVYLQSTLKRAIRALSVPRIPSAIPAAKHHDPPACKPADLRARVATESARAGGIVVLRLHTTGSACDLAESWPTVRLDESAGASQVAKALPDTRAFSAARKVLTTYGRGSRQRTVLTLRRDHGASIALLSTGRSSCRVLRAATIYPSPIATGAGLKVTFARPMSICGEPRILPFLPTRSTAVSVARGVLAGAKTGAKTSVSGANLARWWHGTDSSFPFACGSHVPYREPRGDCSNGTAGKYGAYIGQVGSFRRWHGCGDGLNWVQGNYDAAQANSAHGDGLGAAAYWFAAGPGREPGYSGSVSKARAWGRAQARRVVSTDLVDAFSFPYVVMDIENNGAAPDANGWNTVWNGPCGGSVEGTFIPPNVDRATLSGFSAYIIANTSYFPSVYSAGGIGFGSWGGIFGGERLRDTSEWTFVNETRSVSRFPSRWSVRSVRAIFFGGEHARCRLMWQWSGGNGDLNRFGGDLDQINGRHNGKCPG